MTIKKFLSISLTTIFCTTSFAAEILEYHASCDASAAIAIDSSRFIVGNDEDDILAIYHRDQSGEPLQSFDLSDFLQLPADKNSESAHREADIEAATRIGNRIYWITSHGRNSSAKPRPERQRLFATDIVTHNNTINIVPAGKPYYQLLDALIAAPQLQTIDFANAALHAPEDKYGLNVEGLSSTPQGTLLIGFRNPIPNGKALIVPLKNPAEVIEGKAAQLGEPIYLDLSGLGIRDIAYVPANGNRSGHYLIIAGSYNSADKFKLFTWSGVNTDKPEHNSFDFKGLRPEALIIYAEKPRAMQFLSDDGDMIIGNKPCKKSKADKRFFRSIVNDL